MLRAVALSLLVPALACAQAPEGFTPLFDGKDLSAFKIPKGDNGHWKVVDGVIDYDAASEAAGEKSLFSQKSFGDFELLMDWRIKETPFDNPNVPIVMPDGRMKLNADGAPIRMTVPDSDSGVYLRGSSKAQVNVWCWPVGSGEVYGYRTDGSMSPKVRAGVTPSINADNDIGQWNTFRIVMKGDRLTVHLNGHKVLDAAELPGVPQSGPIALQHHGAKNAAGQWTSPPALVQFRNVYVKEL